MTKRRWAALVVGVLLGLLLLAGAAAFALHRWVGSADFRARVEREASAAIGVPVTLGALAVTLWPVPAVAIDGVRVATSAPLALGRVEVRPDWRAALAGEPALATLVVREAELPREGVDALLAGLRRLADREAGAQAPAGRDNARWLPRRIDLHAVSWVDERGARSRFDAQARIAPDGLPETAAVQVTGGRYEGVQATLAAGAGDARWHLAVRIGGGTAEGPVRLALAPGRVTLGGELAIRGVDPAALTAPDRPLSGRLAADTRYSASGPSLVALVDALQTRTRFSVQGARLHGLDLRRAVQTVGLSRGGETALDELTGEVTTRGRSAQVRELVARSGVLTARGEVAIAPSRALSGRVTVDLAEGVTAGVVGVPLSVGGTLDAPEVTLSRGALLGAAVGTAVMPGVGTGAGAKLGERLGRGLSGLLGR